MVMTLNSLLTQKKMTKYSFRKKSGVPQTTVIDICSGKTRLEKCAAGTVYRIAQALGVSMESLLQDQMEKTISGAVPLTYLKAMCRLVKDMGDINFLIQTLESDEIRRLYKKRWYPETLYLLAMVGYLSRVEWAAPLRTIQRFARRQVETGSLPIQPGAGGESNEKPRTPTAERTGIYPGIYEPQHCGTRGARCRLTLSLQRELGYLLTRTGKRVSQAGSNRHEGRAHLNWWSGHFGKLLVLRQHL